MVFLPLNFPGARLAYARAARLLAKVTALEAEHRVERRIRATAGVSVSTGGFIYNRPMIHHYAPHHDAISPMGNPATTAAASAWGRPPAARSSASAI